MNRSSKAIFVDKDGTLIDDVAYSVDPGRIRFTPGVAEGLYLLSRKGYRIVVVTNQPGVALGLFPEHALQAVHARLVEMLNDVCVPLDAFYYCPHFPAGKIAQYAVHCTCRKPASGMLTNAARDLGIDLARSWMVGDILDDIEAGRGARCRTLLIDNGNETEWMLTPERRPHKVAGDLFEAAAIILEEDIRSGDWTESRAAAVGA